MSLLEHFTFDIEDGQHPHPLQKGGFGQVYLVSATKNTYSTCCEHHSCFGLKQGQNYAVKFFNKKQEGTKRDIINISHQLPGVCKIYFYETMTNTEEKYIRTTLKLGTGVRLSDYCVMEYINGYDIHDLLCKGTKFSEREVKNLTKQVLTTLNKLHQRGYCHRDVKLENVVYKNQTKEYILIDLDTVSNKQFTDDQVGTNCYLSPDVRNSYVSRTPVSIKMWQCADRFALAVMIYELYHFGAKMDNAEKILSIDDVPDFKVSAPPAIRKLYWSLITDTKSDTQSFLSLVE